MMLIPIFLNLLKGSLVGWQGLNASDLDDQFVKIQGGTW